MYVYICVYVYICIYIYIYIYIIDGCRKSLLYNNNKPWKKKYTESCFNVTISSFDGAEICEPVAIHILFLLSDKLHKQYTGLHRDDGLVILRNIFK